MNDRQYQLFMMLFKEQTAHVVRTIERDWTEHGEKFAREALQAEYDRRMNAMNETVESQALYDFNDALVLPSLLLAGLFIDLDHAEVEICMTTRGMFELRDKRK